MISCKFWHMFFTMLQMRKKSKVRVRKCQVWLIFPLWIMGWESFSVPFSKKKRNFLLSSISILPETRWKMNLKWCFHFSFCLCTQDLVKLQNYMPIAILLATNIENIPHEGIITFTLELSTLFVPTILYISLPFFTFVSLKNKNVSAPCFDA